MNFSAVQLAVAVLVPVALCLLVWRSCRNVPRLGLIISSFLLGAIVVWPIIRATNFISFFSAGLVGHYYLAELINEFFATALLEEIGKGLAALLVARIAGLANSPNSPQAWLACAAAAHGGFAAIEGLLGTLGNEGILKVMVGRSLGALTHVSWGVIAAWLLWRGWSRRGNRSANWAAALLFPALLHAIMNAALVEVPGTATLPDDTLPPPAEMLIVLSSMAALVLSVASAITCLIHARRIVPSVPSTHSIETEIGFRLNSGTA